MRSVRFCQQHFRPLYVVALILYLGTPEHVPAQSRTTFSMPNVIGLTVAEAEERVLTAGRNFRATSVRIDVVGRQSDARPAGQIVRQLELPGTPMRPYMDDVGGIYGEVAFRVVVSTGPSVPTSFAMPNVVGLTIPDAERRVLSAGQQTRARSARAVEVGSRSDARPAGQIIRQLESPGTPMRPYMDDVGGNYGVVTFSVVVSTGPEPAPDFVGRTLDEAGLIAGQRKIVLNVGASQRNPQIPRGIVVQQNPVAGQPMPQRRITVYPSAGYPLPNFVKRSLEDARLDSRELAIRLEVESEEKIDVPEGIIFEQEPPAGTLLPFREPVRVKVSRGWPVPYFIGQLESDARKIAQEIGIRLNSTVQDSFEVPAGIIFYQQPPAGEPLPRDQTVNVTVSRGYPLPDLVGMQENQARRLASELNFSLDTKRMPLVDRLVDHIDRQNPEPGTRLPLDMPVSVVVSEGWPTPDFLTLEENEARSLASEKQVILRIVEHRQDRETRPGIVIDQTPRPGTLLTPAQTVGIVVSTSELTPRLIGLTEIEATTLAEREDIILDAAKDSSREFSTGLVSEQFPKPGSPLPADGRVSVTISTGWPTPDFVGKSEEDANGIATDNRVTLVKITPREHFEFSTGLVIEQQPAAKTVIPADRRVKISLSLGWPMAPAAVGLSAGSVQQEFLARYPNAIVDQSERLLTFEPAGRVISQHPVPNVKLGPKQRLSLVASGTKPPWLWPVIGVLVIVVALGAFAGLKAASSSSTTQEFSRTEDPGGIRLQVTKDHGVQTTDKKDNGDTNRTGTGDIVRISVTVDLGEQSAGPIDDKGDET
ncbi:MAG: PASTA domain-containing protein [Xanthomonadales bacterium]|nr:PASTA domain-containing protein [Xanthomonadales bacterium]